MTFFQYTTKESKEVLEMLGSSEQGLSEREVLRRQKIYGLNEIKIKETTLFDILIRQIRSPFFYLLFIAAFIAFLIGETINGLVILVFVLINVCLGFFQEARAVKTIAILKKYIPLKARVKREGKEKFVEQKFLVPGDIVLLDAGNIIPVDLRIHKSENLLVDEEILSGESVPINKISQSLSKTTKEIFEAKNIVFAGTLVISGKAEGIVIGTGRNTVFGEIAKLATETIRESANEKNLLHFSRLILKIVVVSIVFIFLANLIFRGTVNFFDFLIFCIALTVSIIPEALPTVATFALSKGVLALAKKKVVVKRLSAVEDLANIEILCTDKTGTLTENKLQLENIYSSDKNKCFIYGLLSSPYIEEEIESIPNPFDKALFIKTTPEIKKTLKDFKSIFEIPFDFIRLRNSSLLEDKDGKIILITKGAPESILKISSKFADSFTKEGIQTKIKKEERDGKRVLALAFKEFDKKYFSEEDEKDLTFLGYFSFTDPLKITAKPAVELSKKLGVQIKILTGDSPEVAGAIAKEIGLIRDFNEVILGEYLESLADDDFDRICAKFNVFARISPNTKFKIVQSLQKKHEVGFLGEGINDAPALKTANVAIVVKEGADISREASDIILLKKDLRIIVDGICEGRNIFSNINKYIKCTLASNFGNFYSIAAISLVIPFLPMLPTQILLVNLLSDFPFIAVATDKVDAEELRKPKLCQLNNFIPLIIFLAIVSTIFDFIFFGIFHKTDPAVLRTLWFIESILTEILLVFSIRSRYLFLKAKTPSFPLIVLSLLAVAGTLFLPFTEIGRQIFHFITPPFSGLLIVFSLLICYFVVSEAVKLIYFHRQKITEGQCV